MSRLTDLYCIYKVHEEYYVYDGGDFIADIGGFLGLLLGYSITST